MEEELTNVLEKDIKIIEGMKKENKRLRKTNNKLREKISELLEEMKDLKNADEDYKYSFDKGWKKKYKLEAEKIKKIKPEEIDEQLFKIQDLLRRF